MSHLGYIIREAVTGHIITVAYLKTVREKEDMMGLVSTGEQSCQLSGEVTGETVQRRLTVRRSRWSGEY